MVAHEHCSYKMGSQRRQGRMTPITKNPEGDFFLFFFSSEESKEKMFIKVLHKSSTEKFSGMFYLVSLTLMFLSQ